MCDPIKHSLPRADDRSGGFRPDEGSRVVVPMRDVRVDVLAERDLARNVRDAERLLSAISQRGSVASVLFPHTVLSYQHAAGGPYTPPRIGALRDSNGVRNAHAACSATTPW